MSGLKTLKAFEIDQRFRCLLFYPYLHANFLIIMQIDLPLISTKRRIWALHTYSYKAAKEKVGHFQKINLNLIPHGLCNIMESTSIWQSLWETFSSWCFPQAFLFHFDVESYQNKINGTIQKSNFVRPFDLLILFVVVMTHWLCNT